MCVRIKLRGVMRTLSSTYKVSTLDGGIPELASTSAHSLRPGIEASRSTEFPGRIFSRQRKGYTGIRGGMPGSKGH